eukprot:scaffold121286_cov16-Tisochrysis_lutea.AAC.1
MLLLTHPHQHWHTPGKLPQLDRPPRLHPSQRLLHRDCGPYAALVPFQAELCFVPSPMWPEGEGTQEGEQSSCLPHGFGPEEPCLTLLPRRELVPKAIQCPIGGGKELLGNTAQIDEYFRSWTRGELGPIAKDVQV